MASPYDAALADALGDAEESSELVGRLRAGKADASDLKQRLKELAAEHDGRELLVRLAVRVEPET
jgi:hypothetical protein